MNKELREQQLLAMTQELWEEGSEDDSPILYAEAGPIRIRTHTLWFPNDDAVEIRDNWTSEEIEIFYIDPQGKEEKLEEGTPLYMWARELYKEEEGI